MVYDGNLKIKNTDDIINRFVKKDEILDSIKDYLKFVKGVNENEIDKLSNNMLYNVVDDMKGHQNIVDLENSIIDICNNTVRKFGLIVLIENI